MVNDKNKIREKRASIAESKRMFTRQFMVTPPPSFEPNAIEINSLGQPIEKGKKFEIPDKIIKRLPGINTGKFCSYPPDSGVWCTKAEGDLPPQSLHFYFDNEANTCKCFFYNRCNGNENNFVTFEQCVDRMKLCGVPRNSRRAEVTNSNLNRNEDASQSIQCEYFP
ncbi:hypothetical protein B4U79_18044 [Dinothrombium tinctorium]|uniref:BPTI/Kunitz inhibitor domain-containing protein n=1 Tax=Dinothrombium tinctorium TaxID=1965070 RepID=A0A443R8D3_9ACAR|nr:hypothetical protein B4U79_18044 [Dinothrombium tinctorium]